MKSKARISQGHFFRWWALALGLVLAFALPACDGNNDDDIGKVPPPQTDTASEAPPETAKTVVGTIDLSAAEKRYLNDRKTEAASIPDPRPSCRSAIVISPSCST